jgi:hypothetical protein
MRPDLPQPRDYKVLHKSIRTNRNTNTNETFRQKEARDTSPLRWVKVGLAAMMMCATSNTGDIKLQVCAFLEDTL